MKEKQQKIQLILISLGIILFVITYLYYPNIKKENFLGKETTKEENKITEVDKENKFTSFENVEYKGMYDLNKPFKVKSKKAYILNEQPDIVYMGDMHVILYLSDGRVVNITSEQGRYNKVSYDCFFEQNVRASDGNIKIFAENMDLLATDNIAKIYNNVSLDYDTGYLQADKISYDFETKNFKVSMFDDKSIKMKIVR